MRRAMRALAAAVLAFALWFSAVTHRTADEEAEAVEEEPTPTLPAYDDSHEVATLDERRRAGEQHLVRERAEAYRVEAERKRKQATLAAAQAKPKPVAVSRGKKAAAVAQTYEATFYTAFCPTGCIGITATGVDVSKTIYAPSGHRIVAVDPAQIPLGSLVELSFSDGTTFRAVAEDTGGSIRGKRLDVLVASRDEAYRLGRQSVEVRIIRKGR